MKNNASFSLRRQVLFVDDDAEFLEAIGKLFEMYSKGAWEIHLATNTARALAVLDAQGLDLIVLDVQMPVVDGVQFLQLVHRRFPGLPKVVFTGFGSEEVKSSSLSQGADLYLEKPRGPDGFESVYAALNELANWQPQEGFRGLLRQVGLSDVIQMECLAKNSSILELVAEDVTGRIYIRDGAIVHAESGGVEGEQACDRLLALPGGNFSLKPFAEPPKISIEANWEFLVMEAARKRDELGESEARAGESGGEGAGPVGAGVRSGADHGDTDAGTKEARTGGGRRSIDEVMVCSGRGEVLYAWQCKDIESRLKLVQFVEQKGQWMGQRLPFGVLDRVELEGNGGRVVAQVQPDRKLWVRSSPVLEKEAS